MSPTTLTLSRTLISGSAIRRRVKELGVEIRLHYAKRPLVILGLMDGALFFLVDILRELPPLCEVRCVPVKSYHGAKSGGKVLGLDGIGREFQGRDVLVIDDILDTGLTLAGVRDQLKRQGARRVDICVLLNKRKVRHCAVRARWVGFTIDDEFVVGYGLDFNGAYRGLKNIRILKP